MLKIQKLLNIVFLVSLLLLSALAFVVCKVIVYRENSQKKQLSYRHIRKKLPYDHTKVGNQLPMKALEPEHGVQTKNTPDQSSVITTFDILQTRCMSIRSNTPVQCTENTPIAAKPVALSTAEFLACVTSKAEPAKDNPLISCKAEKPVASTKDKHSAAKAEPEPAKDNPLIACKAEKPVASTKDKHSAAKAEPAPQLSRIQGNHSCKTYCSEPSKMSYHLNRALTLLNKEVEANPKKEEADEYTYIKHLINALEAGKEVVLEELQTQCVIKDAKRGHEKALETAIKYASAIIDPAIKQKIMSTMPEKVAIHLKHLLLDFVVNNNRIMFDFIRRFSAYSKEDAELLCAIQILDQARELDYQISLLKNELGIPVPSFSIIGRSNDTNEYLEPWRNLTDGSTILQIVKLKAFDAVGYLLNDPCRILPSVTKRVCMQTLYPDKFTPEASHKKATMSIEQIMKNMGKLSRKLSELSKKCSQTSKIENIYLHIIYVLTNCLIDLQGLKSLPKIQSAEKNITDIYDSVKCILESRYDLMLTKIGKLHERYEEITE